MEFSFPVLIQVQSSALIQDCENDAFWQKNLNVHHLFFYKISTKQH